VHTADWAGPNRDFSIAMERVHKEMSARYGWNGQPSPAHFTSVLCLAWPDGKTEEFEGKVYGHVIWPPRGGNGFGYDPIFVAEGQTLTFGEMEPKKKYAISHRTRAFEHFKRACLDPPGN
jgi:XTP/dITP diphosphohydrolase